MIVDDETMTRESLFKLIPWQRLGMEEVILAVDGADALERAETLPPDILLTDVKMPVMDGIALARAFAERHPQCRVLFLSGYSDKEYLMTAIRLKADAYIEKPVDPAEVAEAVGNAAQDVRRARLRETERRGMLCLDWMGNLLSGDVDRARAAADRAGIGCGAEAWCAASARPAGTGECADALRQALRADADQRLFVYAENGFLHVLSCGREPLPEQRLADAAERLGLPVHIGAASGGGSCEGASAALREAREAARSAFYFGVRLARHTGAGGAQSAQIPQLSVPEHPLHCPEETVRAIADACAALRTGPRDVCAARHALFRIAESLAGDASLLHIPSAPLPGGPGMLWEWVAGFETLADAEGELTGAVHRLAALAQRGAHTRAAVRMIEENLCDYGLSLTRIAGALNLNPSYLCTLFKEETGETVVQYITGRRMRRAKALLSEKNLQIRDVALQVGYADATWFIKRFRQAFGMTPSEYKEKYGQ